MLTIMKIPHNVFSGGKNMKLKKYLKLAKITQKDFAEQLGVTQASISHWCDGSQLPRQETMRKILVLTGGEVTLADFYNDLGD